VVKALKGARDHLPVEIQPFKPKIYVLNAPIKSLTAFDNKKAVLPKTSVIPVLPAFVMTAAKIISQLKFYHKINIETLKASRA
jgi:hypothetical protein